MKLLWCIECGEDVIVEGEGHTKIELYDGQVSVSFCDGPFASVQPPANFEDDGVGDWDLNLVEPGQEELAIMNCNAEVLYQDFEG